MRWFSTEFMALAIIAIFLVAWAIWRARKVVTIFEYQRGLLFEKGLLKGVLEPGRYVFWGTIHQVEVVDVRSNLDQVGNQEILTADGLALRISASVNYQIVDPMKAIMSSTYYQSAAYMEIHSALRDVVVPLTADAVVEQRAVLGDAILARCQPAFERLGLRLDGVQVRDVTFPGELKRVMAQVTIAQKEGLAALERARGEAAALRHLANAAKLLENNPALMQLRILQSLGDAKGATIVLNQTNSSVLPVQDGPQ